MNLSFHKKKEELRKRLDYEFRRDFSRGFVTEAFGAGSGSDGLTQDRKIIVQSFIKQMQKSTRQAAYRGIYEDQFRDMEFSGRKFLSREWQV